MHVCSLLISNIRTCLTGAADFAFISSLPSPSDVKSEGSGVRLIGSLHIHGATRNPSELDRVTGLLNCVQDLRDDYILRI